MVKKFALAIALTQLLSAPALAQAPASPPDCAALIRQVRDQVANRFDNGSQVATELATQAEKLLGDQKAADCLAKVAEAARAAGLAVR